MTLQRLRLARLRAGLTQAELGEHLGYTREHIQRLERGDREPSLGLVLLLAHYFGVSVDWLLGREK